MVPIVLDPQSVELAVIGQGPAFESRIALLRAGGAENLRITNDLSGDIDSVIDGADVVFIAGIDASDAAKITARAKAAGALVNVEDLTDQCDFHMPAVVRRGDLLITASTGGKSPGLARKLRQSLEGQFGEEWGAIVDDVARARQAWLAEGASTSTVAARTAKYIEDNGWLA